MHTFLVQLLSLKKVVIHTTTPQYSYVFVALLTLLIVNPLLF